MCSGCGCSPRFKVSSMKLQQSSLDFEGTQALVCAHAGTPLGNVQSSHMMQWQGVTVGIIGLAEFDWIATLAAVKPEEVQYKDFVAEGSQLAVELRVSQRCPGGPQTLSCCCCWSRAAAATSAFVHQCMG